MHLTSRQEYSAAPAAVFAMLTDEAFLAEASAAMGATRYRATASATRTAVEASLPTPVEVRFFAGPTVQVTQQSSWGAAGEADAREGTFRIAVAGFPVDLSGTMRLAPAASGSTIEYAGDLTVAVPLMGPQVEKLAAPVILEALQTQERVGATWLARAR